MPRVKIEADGRTVEIEASEASHADLMDTALRGLKEAGQRERDPIGFKAGGTPAVNDRVVRATRQRRRRERGFGPVQS